MILKLPFLFVFIIIVSCKKNTFTQSTTKPDFFKAVDISELPFIKTFNIDFKNADNISEDPLLTLQKAGVNTIRLKLWHTPANQFNGLLNVKSFAASLKQKGFKIWLTVHYSDTWADPGNQITPSKWQGLNMAQLKDSVANYTNRIMQEINPDIFQIGNETNSGFLHPLGNIVNEVQMISLMQSAAAAIRQQNKATKIMIHYAGTNGANQYFAKLKNVDYDYIGLSFYPIWHYQTINELDANLKNLAASYSKSIMIAETAYPFTLQWNDWTHNIVGLPSHLLPEYSASPEGQRDFLQSIMNLKNTNSSYIGFCYWGAGLVAYNGTTATDGSPWENQALWDFNFRATPAFNVFKQP